MKRLLAAFAGNTVFANIVLVLILMAGMLAGANMVRESFPRFSLDMVSISVPWPGADPEEVEEGICLKLEQALQNVEGIKQITTTAAEGRGSATVEVAQGYAVSRVLDRIKSRVDGISTFPGEAEKPVVTEILTHNTVMLLALSGELTEKQLKRLAEQISDEIRLLPGISQVTTYGTRDYEITIELPEARLRRYHLSLDQVAEAIRSSSLNLHGGTLRTRGEEIRIRTVGRRYTGAELAEIVILARADGTLLRLGQLAEIHDAFTDDPVAARINGHPAVFVSILKTTEEDALQIARTVNRYVGSRQQTLPPGVQLAVFYDKTTSLRGRIRLLTRNGILGMGLVFLLLWLYLDLRLSFWAGMGIPVSVCGALFILWALGETINMVSLFGFIMVLGIVVDDAIVVGEAIYEHRKQGALPLQAAVDGVNEVGLPVICAVLTTVVAFLPLAHIGGIMGKFIAILPVVVISSLLISLTECLFLLPAHLSHLPDLRHRVPSRRGLARIPALLQHLAQQGMERFIVHRYQPFLERIMQFRYVALATALAIMLLTAGLIKSGLVRFQVFPKIDGFVITSTVEFPEGTPSRITLAALHRIEAAFDRVAARTRTRSGDPLVRKRLLLLGQTLSGTMGRTGPHLGSMQFILLESAKRGIHTKDLIADWEKEVGQIPGTRALTFSGLRAGPKGADIEIWVQGARMPDILAAVREIKAKLATFAGVSQVHSDYASGKNELRLTLRPAARTLGLTVADLARQVNGAFYGHEAFRLQRGKDDIRIKVRYTAAERRLFSRFTGMRILTPSGHRVPLRSVARISFGPGFATIIRTNGLRRVAVIGDVDNRVASGSDICATLAQTLFPRLEARYPGLHISLQGSKKNMRESLASLKVTFPLAILGIFIIVATIFRSYLQPLVILFTVPFGIIGAVFGHLVMGYALSMMSMFGMVALAGIVVNDAIVLIDRINENLALGMEFFTAISSGCRRRFRAVFLTTISTVGGLAPLILETDLQARFLIPMALSVAAGLTFATLLTLAFIPALLVIVNDFRRLAGRLRQGSWPSRAEVEPAALRQPQPLTKR